jgi:hypothetical protein
MNSPKFSRKIPLVVGIFLTVSSLALTNCAKSQKSVDSPAIEPVPDAAVPSANLSASPPASSSASSSASLPTAAPNVSDSTGASAGGPVAVDESAGAAAGNAALPAAVETVVLADIVSRDRVALDSLSVTAATPEDWPDGCLGLGGADDICAFAIVPGWAVTVSQGDRTWAYRTDADGLVIKVEPGTGQ